MATAPAARSARRQCESDDEQESGAGLCAAAIDFFLDLDHAFEINVAKVRVSLPADLRQQLQRPVEQFVSADQSAYRVHPDLKP
jgi:hypothetical protein